MRFITSFSSALLAIVFIASACVSKGTFDRVARDYAVAQQQISSQEDSLNRLTRELSDAKRDLSKSEKDYLAVSAELASTKAALARKDQEYLAKSVELASKERDLGNLRSELAAANSRVANLTQQDADLRSQVSFLQSLTTQQTALGTASQVVSQASPAVVRVRSSGGQGSGLVFDPSGLILTNAHVVGTDPTVTVTLADARNIVATVVGYDANLDVALLKLDSPSSTYVKLGDSNQDAVGADVVAIGYPLGSGLAGQATVTRGILSARRTRAGIQYLQTDAPINPGNSGGPLLNLKGEVIGINTARITTSGAEGIGLALPINDVKSRLGFLSSGGKLAATARLATFVTSPGGYQISYLSDWITASGSAEGDIQFNRPGGGFLAVWRDVYDYSFELSTWKDARVSHIRKVYGATILSINPVSIGGRPAWEIIYQHAKEGAAYQTIEFVLVSGDPILTVGNIGFTILARVPQSQWAANESMLRNLVTSFRLR